MVGDSITPILHDVCMWLITLHNQAHSRDASYNVIISELFVEVAIKVYFADFHVIAIPPYKNMNLVCDLAFCGLDK
jgi:hypothetical protein